VSEHETLKIELGIGGKEEKWGNNERGLKGRT